MFRIVTIFLFLLLSQNFADTTDIKLYLPSIIFNDSSHDLKTILNERFKNELANISNLELLVPKISNDTENINLDSTDEKCNGIECFIAEAKVLNAEKILFSTVSKFGKLWTITSKLIDVNDSTILKTFTEDFTGEKENFLVEGPKTLAKSLTDYIDTMLKISISITTQPDSASLFVNNRKVGITPYIKDIQNAGNFLIRIEKKGYITLTDTITLVAGSKFDKNYELKHSQKFLDSLEQARKDSIILVAKKSVKYTLAEALALLTFPLSSDAKKNRVAILPFETTDTLKDVAKMTSEYAVTYFSAQPNITLIDRDNFKESLKEIELSYTGLIDDKTALETGKKLSANYLLIGTVSNFNKSETIYLRLLNVETGQIVAASSAQLKESLVEQMNLDVFGEKIHPSSALFRSLLVPGWGQFYSNNKVHGAISIGLLSVAAGVTIYLGVDYSNKAEIVDKYEKLDPSTIVGSKEKWITDANNAQQDMNQAADYATYALIGTGVLWFANVIDAVILGNIESKKIKNLYFTALPVPTSNKKFGFTTQLSFTF